MTKDFKKKLIPFSLALAVVLIDQLTKLWVVKTIQPFSVGYAFFGDLIRIINVSNKGVAFSIGYTLSQNVRSVLFSLIPLAMIALVVRIYFRTNSFTQLQRWCICGIVGGGLGNIIDRIFRPSGVVDFIDVKFFGILGLDRWPTFNAADAAIVVCGIILIISFIKLSIEDEKAKKENAK